MAEATPATRDRYVDFLRAISILVVVVGHWFIARTYWTPRAMGASNMIGLIPGAWALTWVLMVMPVFFFVGGFANATTLDAFRRRGEPVGAFLKTRMARLLRPTIVFVLAWLAIEAALHLANACTPRPLRCVNLPPSTLPFGPMWFLFVYLMVVALAPVMLRLHRRFRVGVVVVLVALIVLDELAAFGAGITALRWPNGLWVWLLAHQLGFFYADGTFNRLPRRAFAWMAIGGLAGLLILTNMDLGEFHLYPKSLIGTELDPVSNANPPTLPMAALVFWMIGAVMLLRPVFTRWLERTRVWMLTIYLNSVIMTLFLWHMTAFGMAMIVLWPLGLGHQTRPTASWWLERPLWILVPGGCLALLVAIFGRFERPRLAKAAPAAAPTQT